MIDTSLVISTSSIFIFSSHTSDNQLTVILANEMWIYLLLFTRLSVVEERNRRIMKIICFHFIERKLINYHKHGSVGNLLFFHIVYHCAVSISETTTHTITHVMCKTAVYNGQLSLTATK